MTPHGLDNLRADSGWAGLSTEQWLVKAMCDGGSAIRPFGLYVDRQASLQSVRQAVSLMAGAGRGNLPWSMHEAPTALDAVLLAADGASGKTNRSPGVAVITQDDWPTVAATLAEQAQTLGPAVIVVIGDGACGVSTVETTAIWPTLEPAWMSQVYRGVGPTFAMTQTTGQPVVMRLTGAVADGWATLPVDGFAKFDTLRLTDGSFLELAKRLGWNRVMAPPRRDERLPLGLVGVGSACGDVWRILQQLGITGRMPVAMLHAVAPLDEVMVVGLAAHVQRLVVVERSGDQAYRAIKLAVGDASLAMNCEVLPGRIGRQIDLPGLASHPAMTSDWLQQRWQLLTQPPLPALEVKVDLSPRRAVPAHGSIWRDVMSIMLDLQHQLADGPYMLQTHRRDAMQLAIWSDTTLDDALTAPPFESLQLKLWRGVELPPVPPAAPASEADQSTLVLIDEARARRRCLSRLPAEWSGKSLVLLVAMEPGAARRTNSSLKTWRRLAREMVSNLSDTSVEVNHLSVTDRRRLRRLLEQAVTSSGVQVVLVDKSVNDKVHTIANRNINANSPMPAARWQVDESVCEHCFECTMRTGDPTLTLVQTAMGQKMQTLGSHRPVDGVYQRLDACPAFEQVRVAGRLNKVPSEVSTPNPRDLPDPEPPRHAQLQAWRCHVAMIEGGRDASLVSMLQEAGRRMGYSVAVSWQRQSQAVAAHSAAASLLFAQPDAAANRGRDFRLDLTGSRIPPTTSLTDRHPTANAVTELSQHLAPPIGRTDPTLDPGAADVVAGFDLLETLAAVAPNGRWQVYNPSRTSVVCDDHLLPRMAQLTGQREWNPTTVRTALEQCTGTSSCTLLPIEQETQRLLGDYGYTAATLFGIMVQQGLVPITLSAAKQAIATVWQSEIDAATAGFNLGRRLAADAMTKPPKADTDKSVPANRRSLWRRVRRRRAWVRRAAGRRHQQAWVAAYQQQIDQLNRTMHTLWTPDALIIAAAERAADCILWGGPAYGQTYVDAVLRVFEMDDPGQQLSLTQTVVHNLARVMLIKDEVQVARLLTHPAKRRADRRRWRVNPMRGESLIYHRITRPELSLMGRRYVFEVKTYDWQLTMVSRMSWLRRIVPGWHHRETAFRQWYLNLLKQMKWDDGATYQRWVAVLSLPSVTTGFRDVLWRKMAWARRQTEQWLSLDIEEFVVPTWVGQRQPRVRWHAPPSELNPPEELSPESSPTAGTQSPVQTNVR